MLNKIAFIIPYYGKLPEYFLLFQESIRNQSFDVLFFSDINAPSNIPSNLIWRQLPLNDLQKLITTKTSISVKLINPYKLCDLKPMYGHIFSNYLTTYQFWGWLDIDVVFGDFENFISDKCLDSIDIYSGIKEYTSGAMTIIRNNDYCNELFKKSRDWKYVIEYPKYLGFDECGGHFYAQLKSGSTIFELDTIVQSFTEIIFLENEQGLRISFLNDIIEPEGLKVAKIGTKSLSYEGKKYLLLHLIYFKVRYFFYYKRPHTFSNYYISGLGIFNTPPSLFSILFSKNFKKAFTRKLKNTFSRRNTSFKSLFLLAFRGFKYTVKSISRKA